MLRGLRSLTGDAAHRAAAQRDLALRGGGARGVLPERRAVRVEHSVLQHPRPAVVADRPQEERPAAEEGRVGFGERQLGGGRHHLRPEYVLVHRVDRYLELNMFCQYIYLWMCVIPAADLCSFIGFDRHLFAPQSRGGQGHLMRVDTHRITIRGD